MWIYSGYSEASRLLRRLCRCDGTACLSRRVGPLGCYDVLPLLYEAPSGKRILHRMMDGNYPTSSFADALAPPAQTVASWAYDRSAASVKPRYKMKEWAPSQGNVGDEGPGFLSLGKVLGFLFHVCLTEVMMKNTRKPPRFSTL